MPHQLQQHKPLGRIKASSEQKIRLAVLNVDSEAIKSLVKCPWS